MTEQHDIPGDKKLIQASVLLDALKEHGALTTTTIRDVLSVLHPAGRVRELRQAGHRITTSIIWAADEQGRLHKQALYSLMPEGAELC